MTEKEQQIPDFLRAKNMAKGLPGDVGVVATIQPPVQVPTKYGERYSCQVVINGKDGSTMNTKIFLPEHFPNIHPKSNLGKMLTKYGCNEFSELIGKEVELFEAREGLWSIKID